MSISIQDIPLVSRSLSQVFIFTGGTFLLALMECGVCGALITYVPCRVPQFIVE